MSNCPTSWNCSVRLSRLAKIGTLEWPQGSLEVKLAAIDFNYSKGVSKLVRSKTGWYLIAQCILANVEISQAALKLAWLSCHSLVSLELRPVCSTEKKGNGSKFEHQTSKKSPTSSNIQWPGSFGCWALAHSGQPDRLVFSSWSRVADAKVCEKFVATAAGCSATEIMKRRLWCSSWQATSFLGVSQPFGGGCPI